MWLSKEILFVTHPHPALEIHPETRRWLGASSGIPTDLPPSLTYCSGRELPQNCFPWNSTMGGGTPEPVSLLTSPLQ